ncbi:MAG: VWA domain-containing protein [Kiritimatiellae bacterium]|nr:VWA domain-containing protein [Kiritimatiellia bacterium]
MRAKQTVGWRKRGLLAVMAGCLCSALGAGGAMVPVTLDVEFERAEGSEAAAAATAPVQAGDAWIFVLDHSGSMTVKDAVASTTTFLGKEKKTTRWDALLEALQETLEQIGAGAVVQVVKVGGSQAELVQFKTKAGKTSRLVLAGDADRKEVYGAVKGWKTPKGNTPLYHGLFLACQEAQRAIDVEGRNVGIIVFSDGKDVSDKRYTQASLDSYRGMFADEGFIACLNWINSTDQDSPEPPFGPKYMWAKPSNGGNVVPTICRVRPAEAYIALPNPLSGGPASARAKWVFPMGAERWHDVTERGLEANIQLAGLDGTVHGGESVPLGSDSRRVVFRVPPEAFEGTKGAEFSLVVGLPQSAGGIRFMPPSPVRLLFEGQGSATISGMSPKSGLTAKVGEAIQFAANGTEGATWEWTFGDGASAAGQRVTHAFAAAAPEGISFSVTAKKSGLTPATASGTVTVLEAGVALDAVPRGAKVGDKVEFSCRGTGEVAAYDWFVDGEPAPGAVDAADGGSSRLAWTFDRAGRHTVRVRANMKRVSPEETPEVAFDMEAAPYAAVTRPEPNDSFEAEALVDLEAHVEGGAKSGTWRVADESGTLVGEPIASPVVGDAAHAKFSVPPAGGVFTVTFEAHDGANAVTSAPVRFSAKSKDVRLDVVSPVAGTLVKTGEPAELRAAAKGVSGVVEFWVSAEGREAAKVAEAKVSVEGTAAVGYAFPAENGQGARVLTVRSADGAVFSDPVEFTLETPAGLTLKKPAHNASVAYGNALEFEAEPGGAIEAGAVRWFLCPLGGKEEALPEGKGVHYEHRFGAVPNRKSVPYEVYARAPLPDGTELETDHAVVRAECPALNPRLLTAEKVYETGIPVTFRAEHAGTVGRVVWNFGEDETAEGTEDQTAHTFGKTGKRRVQATLTCATCGEEASAETTVELRCPDLSPRLDIAGESPEATEENLFARGKPIRMSVTCEGRGAVGRVADVAWTFGDGEGETGLDTVNHSYRDYGERTVAVSVRCAVCGREEKATRTLRIDKVPPKAHFKICRSTSSEKSIGGWVAQGTTIALVDQDHGAGDVAHSTGDVARRRWTCDGEPIPGSEDRNIVEWDCRTVGKHVFELTVFDPLGEPAAPESHSVRVYRLWLILLLLALAAGASGWAWWYWGGDEPRFWKLGVREDATDTLGEAEVWEMKCRRKIRRWWKTGVNQAEIPLAEVARWCKASEKEWGKVEKKKCGSEGPVLEVKASAVGREASDKGARPPQVKLGGPVPAGMGIEAFRSGYLWKIAKASAERQDGMVALWVKVQTVKGPNTYLWVRIMATVVFFAAAVWACAKWGA